MHWPLLQAATMQRTTGFGQSPSVTHAPAPPAPPLPPAPPALEDEPPAPPDPLELDASVPPDSPTEYDGSAQPPRAAAASSAIRAARQFRGSKRMIGLLKRARIFGRPGARVQRQMDFHKRPRRAGTISARAPFSSI